MNPSSPPPFSQPGGYLPGHKPGVIVWYYVYLVFTCLMFFCVVGVGAAFLSGLIPLTAEDLDGMPPQLIGGIYLGLGLVFLIPFVVAFFLPRRRWVWVYHLVMICIGMTGCTIVASIPLLIFWIKPEVKAYFNQDI